MAADMISGVGGVHEYSYLLLQPLLQQLEAAPHAAPLLKLQLPSLPLLRYYRYHGALSSGRVSPESGRPAGPRSAHAPHRW
jgi:hypothetical protein